MNPTICVLLLGLLGMASCHGISTLTAQSGGQGTTADWPKGRRQGTLIERIIISANEIPTDRPSGGVVMFSGDSVQLERMQRAQARRRGWTTSLSEGLRASVRFGRNLTKSNSIYALFSFNCRPQDMARWQQSRTVGRSIRPNRGVTWTGHSLIKSAPRQMESTNIFLEENLRKRVPTYLWKNCVVYGE